MGKMPINQLFVKSIMPSKDNLCQVLKEKKLNVILSVIPCSYLIRSSNKALIYNEVKVNVMFHETET